MKKIYSIIVSLLLLPLAASAAKIPADAAQQVAERFFGATKTRSGAVSLCWDGSSLQTRAAAEPAFYVFENGAGGFVIVAGDDRTDPILGYSLTGSFKIEGMPENLRFWFEYLQDGIGYIRSKSDYVPSEKVQAKWQRFNGAATRGGEGVGGGRLLETAAWNQYGPYNLKATDWCGFQQGAVYTGCVATATAIVMRYHKWPDCGEGKLPAYNYRDDRNRFRNVNGYELGHAYDWDNMPLSYHEFMQPGQAGASGNSQESMDAVAQLMLDCGVMVKMLYGTYDTGGSGAYTTDVFDGLVNHMKYDKGMEYIYRDFSAPERWEQTIVDNIDNCGPLICSASTLREEGHAFVIDGYDDDRNIHINWGWGGADNGYYTIPDFDDFVVSQAVLANIKPDAGGSYADPYLALEGYPDNSGKLINGLKVTTPASVANGKFTLAFSTGLLANFGLTTFVGDIILAHADRDNNIKSRLAEDRYTLQPLYGLRWSSQTVSIDVDQLTEGDKLKYYYSISGKDEILPVLYDPQTIVGEIPLKLNADLENTTTVTLDRFTRILMVDAPAATGWTFVSEGGEDISQAVKQSGSVLSVSTSLLKGAYVLTLTNSYSSKELRMIF